MINKVPPHPMYADQHEWADLTFAEDGEMWPDQAGGRGRPRAIQYARVKRVVMRGVHCEALGFNDLYKKVNYPFSPIYKNTRIRIRQNLNSVKKGLGIFCPDEHSKFFYAIENSKEVDSDFATLYMSYEPPSDVTRIQVPSIAPEWLERMQNVIESRYEGMLDGSP